MMSEKRTITADDGAVVLMIVILRRLQTVTRLRSIIIDTLDIPSEDTKFSDQEEKVQKDHDEFIHQLIIEWNTFFEEANVEIDNDLTDMNNLLKFRTLIGTFISTSSVFGKMQDYWKGKPVCPFSLDGNKRASEFTLELTQTLISLKENAQQLKDRIKSKETSLQNIGYQVTSTDGWAAFSYAINYYLTPTIQSMGQRTNEEIQYGIKRNDLQFIQRGYGRYINKLSQEFFSFWGNDIFYNPDSENEKLRKSISDFVLRSKAIWRMNVWNVKEEERVPSTPIDPFLINTDALIDMVFQVIVAMKKEFIQKFVSDKS